MTQVAYAEEITELKTLKEANQFDVSLIVRPVSSRDPITFRR